MITRIGGDDRAMAEVSLHLTDVVKVNDDESTQLLAWYAPRGTAHTLVAQFGMKRLITTRGAAGWSCVDALAGEWHGTAPPVAVPGVWAVWLIGELRQWALPTTLARAAGLASAVCGIRGAVAAEHPLHARALADWNQGISSNLDDGAALPYSGGASYTVSQESAMATPHARSGELLDVLPFAETFPLEQSIALVRSDQWEVLRLVLPEGKVVPEHKVASVTLLQCLEGTVELSAHGKTQKMRAGHLVYLAAGEPHGLKALKDASVLVTMLVNRT